MDVRRASCSRRFWHALQFQYALSSISAMWCQKVVLTKCDLRSHWFQPWMITKSTSMTSTKNDKNTLPRFLDHHPPPKTLLGRTTQTWHEWISPCLCLKYYWGQHNACKEVTPKQHTLHRRAPRPRAATSCGFETSRQISDSVHRRNGQVKKLFHLRAIMITVPSEDDRNMDDKIAHTTK